MLFYAKKKSVSWKVSVARIVVWKTKWLHQFGIIVLSKEMLKVHKKEEEGGGPAITKV